jgi:hypothetical protein
MAKTPGLFIRSKHEPYRRAGFAHSRTGVGIALSALTEKQIQLLKGDPHLVVEDCTFEGDDDAARQEAERAEAERIAAEKAAAEKAAAEKAAAEKAAAEKAK